MKVRELRFYLVRHGQSEANVTKKISGHSETPLTELGQAQAEAIGKT
ncbi:MAG: histidine phosphatase family protein [Candidatus Thorarchaeota archaeon]